MFLPLRETCIGVLRIRSEWHGGSGARFERDIDVEMDTDVDMGINIDR